MFAVIKTGGKQYKVEAGSVIDVELLHVEAGQEVTFDEVLLIADGEKISVGQPAVTGARVKAKVLEMVKAPKVLTFKKIRRQDHRLKKGHRQKLTRLKVEQISVQ